MNLVKNGTVLLAALSVFAMTSCGNKSTMSFAKAREWLKDADTTKAKAAKIKNEVFKWKYTVTGKGMDRDEEKQDQIGGAQLITIGLVMLEDDTQSPVIAIASKGLEDEYTDAHKVDKYAYNYCTAFVDSDTLIAIEDIEGTYDHTYSIKNGLLCASFIREAELPFGDEPVLTFNQEIYIKKDGFVDHWCVNAEKIEFKCESTSPNPEVHADGTISGSFTGTYNFQ